MDEVKVKRVDLLAKLKENRKNHTQLYKDAVEGYKVETTKRLEKALKKVKADELIGSVSITVPNDRTEQYDEAIAMLEMSVEDEIVLPKYEFNNYVLDKWISVNERHMMRTMALSSSNSATYIGGK